MSALIFEDSDEVNYLKIMSSIWLRPEYHVEEKTELSEYHALFKVGSSESHATRI